MQALRHLRNILTDQIEALSGLDYVDIANIHSIAKSTKMILFLKLTVHFGCLTGISKVWIHLRVEKS